MWWLPTDTRVSLAWFTTSLLIIFLCSPCLVCRLWVKINLFFPRVCVVFSLHLISSVIYLLHFSLLVLFLSALLFVFLVFFANHHHYQIKTVCHCSAKWGPSVRTKPVEITKYEQMMKRERGREKEVEEKFVKKQEEICRNNWRVKTWWGKNDKPGVSAEMKISILKCLIQSYV